MKILGAGISVLDAVVLSEELSCVEGVSNASIEFLPGGSTPNVLAACRKLGAEVELITAVGSDGAASIIRNHLQNDNIAVERMLEIDDCKSVVAVIMSNPKLQRKDIFVDVPQAYFSLDTDLTGLNWDGISVVHCNGHLPLVSQTLVENAITRAVPVSISGALGPQQDVALKLLSSATLAVVSADFAKLATGVADLRKATRDIVNEGVSLCVVTDGSNGCWACSESGFELFEPAAVVTDFADSTGAGDAFHAAMLVTMFTDISLQDRLRISSKAGALACQSLGGRCQSLSRQFLGLVGSGP